MLTFPAVITALGLSLAPPPLAPSSSAHVSSYTMLPKTYDPLFQRYRGRLPMNFMRALTKRESNFNPNDTQGPAWGLMQIVEVVRSSWNNRNPGERYTRYDLLRPEVNVKMASSLLNRIVIAYGKHPDRNMKEDWNNPEFVKLVLAGWNSGYSEAGGVGRVARYLESRSIPVTHENVFRYASSAGATRHLSNTAKKNWQAGVANLYFAEGGAGYGNVLLRVAIAGGLGYGVYRIIQARRG